jgi:hypothetical protein
VRIGRTIIIPTILALGAAGTILASTAAPAMASQSPNVPVHHAAFYAGNVLYHT